MEVSVQDRGQAAYAGTKVPTISATAISKRKGQLG